MNQSRRPLAVYFGFGFATLVAATLSGASTLSAGTPGFQASPIGTSERAAARSVDSDGWFRPEGVSAECRVAIAKDAAHARAPSGFSSCGKGCLELAVDWRDEQHRLFGALGAARNGKRRLAYTRDLADALELQIVSLPENTVVFDARVDTGFRGCALFVRAITADAAWIELIEPKNGNAPARAVAGVLRAGSSVPVFETPHAAGPAALEYAMGNSALFENIGRLGIAADRSGDGRGPLALFRAPANAYIAGLRAADDRLFYGAVDAPSARIETYARSAGAAAFIGTPSKPAFGLETDGQDFVWFEAEQPPDPSGRYSSIELVTAKFATNAAELRPRALRRAYKDTLVSGRSVVGGGYSLALESRSTNEAAHLILTRLADGAFWTIPPHAGLAWGEPLYVDGAELAVVENASHERFVDKGLRSGEAWTIARLEIASIVAGSANSAP